MRERPYPNHYFHSRSFPFSVIHRLSYRISTANKLPKYVVIHFLLLWCLTQISFFESSLDEVGYNYERNFDILGFLWWVYLYQEYLSTTKLKSYFSKATRLLRKLKETSSFLYESPLKKLKMIISLPRVVQVLIQSKSSLTTCNKRNTKAKNFYEIIIL